VPETLEAQFAWWAPWRYWRIGKKPGEHRD